MKQSHKKMVALLFTEIIYFALYVIIMCKSINLLENYIRLWYNTIQVLIIRTKKSIQNKNYRKDEFS